MPVETLPCPTPREAPWMAGLRAARANLVPGLIVQAVMLGLLLVYWFYPPTTLLLNRLAMVKERLGYGFATTGPLLPKKVGEKASTPFEGPPAGTDLGADGVPDL